MQQLGVRINQQLLGVEAVAAIGIIGAVDAVAMKLSRTQPRQVSVPDLIGAPRQGNTLELTPASRVEKAKIHASPVRRKEREIDAAPIPIRTQWQRYALLDLASCRARILPSQARKPDFRPAK